MHRITYVFHFIWDSCKLYTKPLAVIWLIYALPAYALYVGVGELVSLGTISFLPLSIGDTMLAREIKRPVHSLRMRKRLLDIINHPVSALLIVILWTPVAREVGHSGEKIT